MVKAEPAMPAMPQPIPKVRRSTFSVLMPTAPAMTRFCTTARTCWPQRERYIIVPTTTVMSTVSTMMNMPLIGISMVSVACQEPSIQAGRSTPTSRAPNTER